MPRRRRQHHPLRPRLPRIERAVSTPTTIPPPPPDPDDGEIRDGPGARHARAATGAADRVADERVTLLDCPQPALPR